MSDVPIIDPQAAAAASFAEHKTRVDVAAAQARTPGEWIDIFQSIIEHSVRTTMEANGDGGKVLEQLSESRTSMRRVRERFEEHGLPILDGIDIDGPQIMPDALGALTNISWPRGEWVKFYWPNRTDWLEFRGHQALVAVAFIMWWSSFQALAEQQNAQLLGKPAPEGIRRMIEPGTPEWDNYWAGKAADIAKGVGQSGLRIP